MHIIAICGSLRSGSINKALALEAQKMANFDLHLADIGNLPLYNQDVEISSYPAEAAALKESLSKADGILFFCPEFNRGIPGVLKNAIDWVSRPSGTHPFSGKPVGVLGASSGPRGTIVAQYDLKRMMNYFGAHLMGNPEFYVDNSDKKIDGGEIRDEKTREYLQKYVDAFKAHAEKLS